MTQFFVKYIENGRTHKLIIDAESIRAAADTINAAHPNATYISITPV